MRGRGSQRPVPSTTPIPTRCANGGAWHTVVPSPDTREPPRRSSHLTRPVDIARSGYFSHPRRASRDELASGASRLASTLSRHALLLVFRPVGAVGGPSRVGDSAGFAPARADHLHRARDPESTTGTSTLVAGCGRRSARASLRSTATPIVSCRAASYRRRLATHHHHHAASPSSRRLTQPVEHRAVASLAERHCQPHPRNGMTIRIQRTGTTRTTDSRCLWPNAISGREYGWRVVTYSSPNRLGLIKPRWKPSSRRGAIGLVEDRPDWRW